MKLYTMNEYIKGICEVSMIDNPYVDDFKKYKDYLLKLIRSNKIDELIN